VDLEAHEAEAEEEVEIMVVVVVVEVDHTVKEKEVKVHHYAPECKNPRRERNNENNLIQEHHDDEPALLLSTFESNEDGGRVLLNEENVTPQLRTHGAAPNQSRVWYLDTGASNHMTGDKYKFKNLNEMVQGYVKFGNETKVGIEGKGSIVFQCKNCSTLDLEGTPLVQFRSKK
ncbi:hypothetical protein Tco_0341923, partial [Tanacetum coccineum]